MQRGLHVVAFPTDTLACTASHASDAAAWLDTFPGRIEQYLTEDKTPSPPRA